MGLGCYGVVVRSDGQTVWDGLGPILIALSWLYVSVRPIIRPTSTPPYDLLVFYILQLTAAIVQFATFLFYHNVYGSPFPSLLVMVAVGADVVGTVLLVVNVLGMPIARPSIKVDKAHIVRILLEHGKLSDFHSPNLSGQHDKSGRLLYFMAMGVVSLDLTARLARMLWRFILCTLS